MESADEDIAAFLGHINRCWEAEVEIASRLRSRSQLLSGGMIALLGLGVSQLVWFRDPSHMLMMPLWIVVTIHFVLLASVVIFARSLIIIYVRKGSGAPASDKLTIKKEDHGQSGRRVAFTRTNDAYLDLKERNETERKQIQRGQNWAFFGIALFLLAVFMYLSGQLWATIRTEASSHERTDTYQSERQPGSD